MTTMNRLTYQQLVDQDLAWLAMQPRTLEREHVIQIVRTSVELLYGPEKPDSAQLCGCDPGANHKCDRHRDDVTCEHGTAMDVHCCNCHSGFLFDSDSCTCL